ncbi:SRPBCC domain-containing protein [Litorihabitans aurantiacus]|uniref:Activator of HSP90 ATPase n=1 Tax=Litorihabitans aurantiacus TaxID=1930061 RepID=A0AA37XH03_9MICO|nr:SRPBCC domain-containing protein [Litorihabitans aurantiacus]GMA32886.1 activator of HSP90 ATPase [Litorihabitans aurantiacus]
MRDVLDELAAVGRAMGSAHLPAGDAYTMELRRVYRAELDDVWSALTDVERLARWMGPVTGDLRAGGSFEVAGAEHGDILRCEPPHLLRVSWMFGPEADAWPGTSEVEIRLAVDGPGRTWLELVHAASVVEPMFPTYGPGAGGVGWDLHLRGLAILLHHGESPDHSDFRASELGRAYVRGSAAAWGEAHLAAGGDPSEVAAAVRATTAFYLS